MGRMLYRADVAGFHAPRRARRDPRCVTLARRTVSRGVPGPERGEDGPVERAAVAGARAGVVVLMISGEFIDKKTSMITD